jgi:hypothetical protein
MREKTPSAQPVRSAEQQSKIKDRISRPLEAVSREQVLEMLRRYNADV